MMKNVLNNLNNSQKQHGIVLLVTLVLLVVLSTLGYTLTSRVAAQRHRNQYLIDYSNARYGCDSAVKYALATLEELDPQLISRPNEPDFSDLFALDAIGLQELLAEWEIGLQNDVFKGDKIPADATDGNDVDGIGRDKDGNKGFDGSSSFEIRGPYGPAWPLVTQPSEFEIGSAKVQIEIEDENAKYPLGWALLDDRAQEREIQAGFVTFCELAGLKAGQIDALGEQLAKIAEIKPFKIDFKPITKSVKAPVTTANSTSRTARTSRTQRTFTKTIPVSQQVAEQTSHFAKLFHSSLIDAEMLARPTIVTENRKESPLKYIGMWGSQKVNINTAPRHVLEAAFIFGGNEVDIAEEIIQLRRENAFAEVADLKDALSRYSDSITKCEKYITTKSRFFTIKITAASGVARASSIIAITKDGETVTRIAIING
ncbi:MAG: type II secretion system protein GspK [Planctomycetota bacterium]